MGPPTDSGLIPAQPRQGGERGEQQLPQNSPLPLILLSPRPASCDGDGAPAGPWAQPPPPQSSCWRKRISAVGLHECQELVLRAAGAPAGTPQSCHPATTAVSRTTGPALEFPLRQQVCLARGPSPPTEPRRPPSTCSVSPRAPSKRNVPLPRTGRTWPPHVAGSHPSSVVIRPVVGPELRKQYSAPVPPNPSSPWSQPL